MRRDKDLLKLNMRCRLSRDSRIQLIKKIQERRDSKVFCYLTSDRQNASALFAKDILPIFSEQLKESKYKSIDIFLFTLGGDTLAAFGLNRLLREYTENLNILVPDKCLSAGTLFALGCNQVLMTKTSYLGPIDPSIQRPLNPAVNINGQIQNLPLSVESVAGFKGLVKDEWGIKKQPELSVLLKLLSEKVHPLALGDVYRARQQIELLATNLLKQHRKDSNSISDIVQKLTKELGSHDYLIFRKEAKKILGTQLTAIDPNLESLIRELYKSFVEDLKLGKPFDPNIIISSTSRKSDQTPRTTDVKLKLAVIEGEERGDHFIQEKRLTEAYMQSNNAPPIMVTGQEILFEGWKTYN